MCRILPLAAALLLAGCAPAATTAQKAAPTSATLALAPADAYARTVRELAGMGYQVVAGDPAAGFLRAEKPRTGNFGVTFFDVMSVTFASPEAGRTVVHVATSTDQANALKGTERRPSLGVSKQLQRDAQAMLARLEGAP